MSDFLSATGAPTLVQLNTDGSVPVAAAGVADDSTAVLLERLIWEVRELRRVYCEATGEWFQENPIDTE